MDETAEVREPEPLPAIGTPPAQHSILDQAIRFVLVGIVAAGVDFGVYSVELGFGVWADLAKGVSFILGTTTAYLLNRRFTFRHAAGGAAPATRFAILYTATFFVNVGVNALGLRLLPAGPWQHVIAWVIAQAVATIINFILLRTVVFPAVHPEQSLP